MLVFLLRFRRLQYDQYYTNIHIERKKKEQRCMKQQSIHKEKKTYKKEITEFIVRDLTTLSITPVSYVSQMDLGAVIE